MKIEELEIICKTVVELTRLRQNECKHLCVENTAANIFGKLLNEFDRPSADINDGYIPGGIIWVGAELKAANNTIGSLESVIKTRDSKIKGLRLLLKDFVDLSKKLKQEG